ncbi:fructose-specific PTS transporter subunit EIIC [Spiroplasma sp. SV19]|uniref:PTS fructose transporter subunit IIABC n=1 Tax=Spiroplasma sp. SV19 TaxID=2570468 RepID=UPI0024B65288|nr:fructose-specific PTS transporter subunit EIIC [Spiroplasma sp. SV19]WHQ37038.1 PTS fructose transporter subunit IIABC [Spiroplasma sp. SV19]
MYNEIFNEKHIILDSTAKTKEEAFLELAKLAETLGYVSDPNELVKGFEAREKESSTGFEDGFAIPHARIKAVKKEAVLFIRFKDSVDWKAMDGKPTKVAIALIIPEAKSGDIHLGILSEVARKLMDENFKKAMKIETNKTKIQAALLAGADQNSSEKVTKPTGEKPLILAMTACATGVAHTFLAADKLNQTGPKLGYDIKVETHGAEGVRNDFTDAEIKRAEVIIAATDIGLDMTRFGGKKVYICPVAKAIKDPEGVINTALKEGKTEPVGEFTTKGSNGSGQKVGVMKHLMAGVSYMVPIVILGGIFIAISLGLAKAIYGPNYENFHGSSKGMGWIPDATGGTAHWGELFYTDPLTDPKNFFYYLNILGGSAFTLMIPVLGAFIANSIAGRSAIAPAIVVSFIGNNAANFYPLPGIEAVNTPTGFVGAIAAGLAVGYTVKWINTWNVPKGLKPVMPIFFIPIVVGFVYGMIMMFVIGSTVGWVMGKFQEWISKTWGNISNASNVAIGLAFGLLIGAMAGFDMGGPVNKVAFLASTGLIGSKIYTPMGAMAVAIPVAPMGMGIATWIFKPFYNEEQRTMGSTAFFMGCIGISEGAIPFAVNDPKRVIPSNIVGSAIAGGLAGAVGIADLAGHGGPIVGFLSALGRGNGDTGVYGWAGAWQWTLLAFLFMAIGALITAFMYGFWQIADKRRTGETISMKQFVLKTRSDKVTADKKIKAAKKATKKDANQKQFSKRN